jgi:LPPG:FO 2-phospho-L-lactate transferase
MAATEGRDTSEGRDDIGGILEGAVNYRNDHTVLLSGGIGGARMARGFAGVLAPEALRVVVNVGDDQEMYGVHVAADLDTVVYTLAGQQGPHGWGIAGDSFDVMDHLAGMGVDTSFRLGDRDLATCMWRTSMLRSGTSLSEATAQIAESFGLRHQVGPVTDDPVATRVQIDDGTWLDFQDYFVLRRHRDEVMALDYDGASAAAPAPGLLDAIRTADRVVIAPSNPPLSIWPMLAIPGVREALRQAVRIIAVSPLISGSALKGPADRVMASLGLPAGNAGVLTAYEGLLSHLVIHETDAADAALPAGDVEIVVEDTLIGEPAASERLARRLLALV